MSDTRDLKTKHNDQDDDEPDGTPGKGNDSDGGDGDGTDVKTVPLDVARKWENRAKANAKEIDKLKTQLQAYADRDKTDAQRATDKMTAAEKDATDAKREAMRLRVALRKGLTETQAKRLVGDTEEDLEADAEELLASFQPANEEAEPKGGTPSGRPKERLRSGAAPDEEPDETDPAKLAAKVPRP